MSIADPGTTPSTTPDPTEGDVADLDVAVVSGTLSSSPTITELASGSVLYRYEVTSRQATGTDTVPVVWFDPRRPPRVDVGDRVIVTGRVRRRFFRAGGATRSATEIVASSVARRGSNTRARHALETALDSLAG